MTIYLLPPESICNIYEGLQKRKFVEELKSAKIGTKSWDLKAYGNPSLKKQAFPWLKGWTQG